MDTATTATTMKRSLAEPTGELRRVKIVECGESLVDFLQDCPALLFDRPRFRYRRETLLRQSVAAKLCAASRALPPEYRLAVIEGWRAPHIQRRMYLALWSHFQEQHPAWSETTLKRVVNRFSAPLDTRVPPPHTTGAALDVMLADAEGQLLDHVSPYEPFDPRAFPFAAPGLSATAQATRRVLAEALHAGGLSNYPSEFWHWSYGDQGWAYRTFAAHALYAATAPPNYQPPADELQDAPLEFIEADDAPQS